MERPDREIYCNIYGFDCEKCKQKCNRKGCNNVVCTINCNCRDCNKSTECSDCGYINNCTFCNSSLYIELTQNQKNLHHNLKKIMTSEWEFYMNPYVNGLKPDIICFSKDLGIIVWKIIEKQEAHSKNKKMSDSKYANFLKESILTRIVHTSFTKNNISVCLFYPENDEKIQLLNNKYDLIFSFRNQITKNDIDNINLNKMIFLNEKKELKFFKKLINKLFISDEHKPDIKNYIELSNEQERNIEPMPGHYRIKGPAGSGKTLVLAYRGAKLASQGKKVLFVTYGITMRNYISDLLREIPVKYPVKNIEVKSFFEIVKEIFHRNDCFDDSNSESSKNDKFKELNEMLKNVELYKKPIYDAILIDEGQDFCLEWYLFLSSLLSERDELVLVADNKQNIYGTDQQWTDKKMTGVKFKGKWRLLSSKSYRLPDFVFEMLQDFSEQFLEKAIKEIETEKEIAKKKNITLNFMSMDKDNSLFFWKNFDENYDYIHKISEIVKFLGEIYEYKNITVMYVSFKEGKIILEELNNKAIPVNHFICVSQTCKTKYQCSETRNGKKVYIGGCQQSKKRFYIANPGVKLSTIASFKGWESENVILVLKTDKENFNTINQLIYTGLSRTTRNMIVLNFHEKFNDFGNKWNNKWLERKQII